ncbi:tyrosine-type recombinase/integrase [Burkholderia sp. Ac-20384]|uniref:tyrosine-type recombinase/integrase n=1 Tax=Burkholderia sp. Ac-20384 TaxID=2703902 RepID=UPI00198089F7|nr:integrase arm-type DNA-binding domain-containing protein [Burkholderia sp. Ac-20384]MBN3822373.1 tyrosine-type recombinase/integrase [Burkholderia sp. Ac-20384]
MPLTDIKIRQAKADSKAIKITDANGLYIEVRPSGSKLWRYRYEMVGKENLFALGEYPQMSLQEARKARDEARALVKKGIHPAHARQEEIFKTVDASKETFKAVCDEWLGKKKKAWSERHHGEVSSMLNADAYPIIGSRPMRSITSQHILAMVQRVEMRGSPTVAIKLRQYTSSVFQYAVITQRADADPASVLRGVTIKPPTENSRPLTHAEMHAIYRYLPHYQSRRTAIAIKLLMYFFTRTIELCRARWEEIDLEANEWKIPPDKIKSRRMHIVPIAEQPKALLLELKRMYGGKGWLLPILHSNRKNPHMARGTVNKALEYIFADNQEAVTGHDFRATASTYLHEMGWRDEVVEMQLAHKDKDKTRATYNHAKYMPERREMMQAWADWLDGVEKFALENADSEKAA